MAVYCDGCDSRMQSQTLIRLQRGRSVTTHCWYCWDCKADRLVVPLSTPARLGGWRSWLTGGRNTHPVAV